MIEDKLSDFAKSQIDNALSYNEGMRQGYIQAKSEWTGLTEDQIDKLEKEFIGFSVPNIYNFVQAIEAKLKEKNGY